MGPVSPNLSQLHCEIEKQTSMLLCDTQSQILSLCSEIFQWQTFYYPWVLWEPLGIANQSSANLQRNTPGLCIVNITFSPVNHFLSGRTGQIATVAHMHQFSSLAQSCLNLCNPMNCSTPGLPVHHHLPEFTQTHVHRVHDAIQPSHPWSSPSPPAPNPSQNQSLFQRINASHEMAKVLEFQL